ncbi:MAG: START-like domain-containing protein [Marinilabiliales bacterium]
MAKTKYSLEFPMKTSTRVLYNRLSTASGLSEWFADNVHVNGNIFTFIWDNSEENAEMVSKKDQKYVRFKWIDDEDDDAYFEFKINVHELTGDTSLIITDFAEDDEIDDAKDLWETQVNVLRQILGS